MDLFFQYVLYRNRQSIVFINISLYLNNPWCNFGIVSKTHKVCIPYIFSSFFSMYWVQKLSSLKRLVLSLKEMNLLTSKTVRLLMEMDLISKGFVL